MPSPQSRVIKQLILMGRLRNERVTNLNLAVKRKKFARLERLFRVPRWVRIVPMRASGFKGEWVLVPQIMGRKVMLYFHGGGFVFNGTKLHRRMIAKIAKAAHIKALSIDYSLSPEVRFPVAIDEALAAYKWLLERYDAKDIIVAGDSSGGSISLSLIHTLKEQRLPMPACVVLIAPAVDAATFPPPELRFKDTLTRDNMNFFVDSYFGNTPRNHPVASPIYGSFKGFPPMLVHIDKGELLYYNCARMVEKARKAGVDVTFYETDGLWHLWHLFDAYVPEARTAIQDIADFIRTKT